MASSRCMAQEEEGSMRMRPSQSSVMKLNVGSTCSLTTSRFEPVALGDARPIVHARATQRIDAEADTRRAHRLEVEHAAEIGDVGGDEIVFPGGGGAPRLRVRHAPYRPAAWPRAVHWRALRSSW